jgi:hypothetical protein
MTRQTFQKRIENRHAARTEGEQRLMRLQRFMPQHVGSMRLYEIADQGMRLRTPEVDHLEQCSECLTVYAKAILQAARARAKDKCKQSSPVSGGDP